jgi:hypothetical protein
MVGALLFAVLFIAAPAAAESLHSAPLGTAVSGSFSLAGKIIPLPPGEFKLAASATEEARRVKGSLSKPRTVVARIVLTQVEGSTLRAAVTASTSLEVPPSPGNWISAPCARGGVLFKEDRANRESHGEFASEDCLIVDAMPRYLGPNAKFPILREAADWLAAAGVRVPVAVVRADVSRVERRHFINVSYAFNPQSYGCGGDAKKDKFVERVTAWGKSARAHLDKVIASRDSIVQPVAETERPSILRCP